MKAYLLAAMFAAVANAQVPSDLALSTFGPATFSSPVAVRSPHDGTGRVFVVEQGGTIQVLDKDGASLGTFLDISTQVTAGGEQGLLGLAFD